MPSKTDRPQDWAKRLGHAVKMGRQAARNFATHSTTGQKIAAAGAVGGTVVGGVKRGRREWKRGEGKPDRLRRTVKGTAKGAFSGAIGGTITGYGVGKAVDYMTGQKRSHESIEDVLDLMLDNPNESISDVVDYLVEAPRGKFSKIGSGISLMRKARKVLSPKGKGLHMAGYAALGALKGATSPEHDERGKKVSLSKRVAKGAAKGAAAGYGMGVLGRLRKSAEVKTRHRLRRAHGGASTDASHRARREIAHGLHNKSFLSMLPGA